MRRSRGCWLCGGGGERWRRREGPDECWRNAPGMSNRVGEGRRGLFFFFFFFFKRQSAQPAQMWPHGKSEDHHSTPAYFPPSPKHTLATPPTHTPCTHSSQAFPALCPVSAGERRPPPKFCRCFFLFCFFYLFTTGASSRRWTQRSESNSQLRFWAWNLLLFLIPPVKSRPQFDPLRWPIRLGRDITPGP